MYLHRKTLVNNRLNIFPNPISDILHVENSSSNDIELSLYNLNGSKLFSANIKGSEQNKFNIEFLESGVYLIQSIDGDQQHWEKFVVK